MHLSMKAAPTFLNQLRNYKTTTSYRPNSSESTQVKALTTKILNHINFGQLTKAISILFASPVSFPFPLYAHLFQICSQSKAIVEARKLQSHLVSFHPRPPIFLLNRAIEIFGKCKCLDDVRSLFDEMPERNGGSWNAVITAYSRNGKSEEAINVFSDMHKSGVYANEITFASILGSCASAYELWFSRQVHGLIIKYGFSDNVILESSLVDVYGKCGIMSESRKKFNEIKNPNDISWNVIVRRYLEMNEGKESVRMFFEMIRLNSKPMNFTVSNALIACSTFNGLIEGFQIHGYSIKTNINNDEVISSSIIVMYVKCGDLTSARVIYNIPSSNNLINLTSLITGYAKNGRTKDAREIFDEMPIEKRNVISWNAMLAGYLCTFEWDEALQLFALMRESNIQMDHITLGLIINVSSSISDVQLGKQIHGYMYRHYVTYSNNLFLKNAILDMYGKCGNMKSARLWFYEMRMSHHSDNVSWNCLISNYGKNQLSEESMMIFNNMLARPSKYTFATLLASCANVFSLECGKQIHAYIIRNSYEIDVVLGTSLIDMYCKCRNLKYGINVFNQERLKHDVILYNCMMLGCYGNKKGKKVFELFDLMEKEGIKPDYTTIQAMLLACISENRVKLGKKVFDLMGSELCVIPRLEHYELMIELYGKYGYMDELKEFITEMPFDLTVSMLYKVVEYSGKFGYFKLEKWAINQLNILASN